MPEDLLENLSTVSQVKLREHLREVVNWRKRQFLTPGAIASPAGEVLVAIEEKLTQEESSIHLYSRDGRIRRFSSVLKEDRDPQSENFRTGSPAANPQSLSDVSEENASGELLAMLLAPDGRPMPILICEAELTRFDAAQVDELLLILWNYILENRNSNNRKELVATGSAIRKFIALMPMEKIGDLAVLLESGTGASLPIELEIEVAKMIYRNFEVFPSVTPDPHPELAQRLMEIAETYTNPRLLPRDKYSAAASRAIGAIVAMQSARTFDALRLATQSRFRWFAEIIEDDLDRLRDRWADTSPAAVTWLDGVRLEANRNDNSSGE